MDLKIERGEDDNVLKGADKSETVEFELQLALHALASRTHGVRRRAPRVAVSAAFALLLAGSLHAAFLLGSCPAALPRKLIHAAIETSLTAAVFRLPPSLPLILAESKQAPFPGRS